MWKEDTYFLLRKEIGEDWEVIASLAMLIHMAIVVVSVVTISFVPVVRVYNYYLSEGYTEELAVWFSRQVPMFESDSVLEGSSALPNCTMIFMTISVLSLPLALFITKAVEHAIKSKVCVALDDYVMPKEFKLLAGNDQQEYANLCMSIRNRYLESHRAPIHVDLQLVRTFGHLIGIASLGLLMLTAPVSLAAIIDFISKSITIGR